MYRYKSFVLPALLVLVLSLGVTMQADAIFIPTWIAPDGLPTGASGVEFYLQDSETFIFNSTTYSPPQEWMLFAGAGFNLSGFETPDSPVKICFFYPKAWASVGEWHPRIYRLDNGQWIGYPTSEETISGYGVTPFVCTSTTLPGMYIVSDYYFCESNCEVIPTEVEVPQ